MKSIGIVARERDTLTEEISRVVIDLMLSHVEKIYVYPPIMDFPEKVVVVDSRNKVKGEVVVVIGGDGTILKALLDLEDKETPIMGIGIGERNFLASVDKHGVKEAISLLLSGKYESKMLNRLQTRIGESLLPPALNEVYITSSTHGKAINLRVVLKKNDEGAELFVGKMDGLIAATPTGSTAYSLSAGGSIISEELNAFILTPVCSQKYIPPVVLPCGYEVVVESLDLQNPGMVVIDGNLKYELTKGEKVSISCSDTPAKIICVERSRFGRLLKAVNLRR